MLPDVFVFQDLFNCLGVHENKGGMCPCVYVPVIPFCDPLPAEGVFKMCSRALFLFLPFQHHLIVFAVCVCAAKYRRAPILMAVISALGT